MLIMLLISFIFSIPTLFLIDDPIKYPLFSFQLALIFLFSLKFSKWNELSVNFEFNISLKIIDILFTIMAITLFLIQVFGYNVGIHIPLAIIILSILPGYVLLRLLDFHCMHSWIEFLVISFTASFILTNLIGGFILSFKNQWSIILTFIYVLISLIPFLKNKIVKAKKNLNFSCKYRFDIIDGFLLIWIVTFVVYVIWLFYPDMGLNWTMDIYNNFSSAARLIKGSQPVFSNYPFFILHEAILYKLLNLSMLMFQTTTAYLSIFVILSFYIMSQAYLKSVDKNLPIMSTIFWTVFSGFGWISFLTEKISNSSNLSQMALLGRAWAVSFWDVGYGSGSSLWFWYRGQTLGFTLLFALIYLLRRKSLSNRSLIILCTILVTALSLSHPPEIFVFVSLLLIIAIFAPKTNLRLSEGLRGTVYGLIFTIILSLFLEEWIGIGLLFSNIYIFLLLGTSIFAYFLVVSGWRGYNFMMIEKFVKPFSILLILVFSVLLLTWLFSVETFNVNAVNETGYVPFFLYPAIFGIVGFLSFSGLALISKKHEGNCLILFSYLFLVVLIFSKLVSFININYLYVGYFERRLLPIAYAACAILASYPLLKLIKTIKAKRNFVAFFLIGFIIFSGVTSTCLTIEFQKKALLSNSVTETELDIAEYLSKTLSNGTDAPLFALPSSLSKMGLSLLPSYKYGNMEAWSSKYPEEALTVLYPPSSLPPYIYLGEDDLQVLDYSNQNGFLSQHLLRFAPQIYQDNNASIYHLLNATPPSVNGEAVLVIPESVNDDNYLFSYDLLSLGGYDYTTRLDSDSNINWANTVVIPYDDTRTQNLINLIEGTETGIKKTIIVINSNGYGPLLDSFGSMCGSQIFFQASSADEKGYIYLLNENLKSFNNIITDSGNDLSFIVGTESKEIPYPLITDESPTSFWIANSAESGNISVPLLSIANSSETGTNGVKINVTDGEYLYWYLTHRNNTPQDWSNYDFFTFVWNGNNSGETYYWQFSTNSGNKFWYSFVDDWEGQRKVLFPLWMSDGEINLNNVTIRKSTTNNATWNSIDYVNLQMDAANINNRGTFELSNVGLDVGHWINVSIIIKNNLNNTSILPILSIYNGTSYLPLETSPNVATSPLSKELFFLSGLNAESIYGKKTVGYVQLITDQDGNCNYTLSLKLIPNNSINSNVASSEQYMFKIFQETDPLVASEIIGVKNVKLPINIDVVPFEAKNNVSTLSLYSGSNETPLAMSQDTEKSTIYYINAYPIIHSMLVNPESAQDLYPILGILLNNSGIILPRSKGNVAPIFVGNVGAFAEAYLQGDINVKSDSIIFPQEQKIPKLELVYNDRENILYNITNVSIFGSITNFTLETSTMEIKAGRGYYSSIGLLNDTRIYIYGKNLTVALDLDSKDPILLECGSYLELRPIQNRLNLLVRAPQITAVGEVCFKEMYALQGVATTLRTLGQNLTIKGKIGFSLPISDTYSLFWDFSWKGSMSRQPSIIQWNESDVFLRLIPWFIVLAVIIVALKIASLSNNYDDIPFLKRKK